MTVDLSRGSSLNGSVQISHFVQFHIIDLSAVSAYKVVMWRHVSVVMVRAVSTGQFQDLTRLHQQVQISIYSSKTDIWKFFPDTGV